MKESIRTEQAPAAIGPYSQAIKTERGTMIFCSGQIPLDPKTGALVGKTVVEQCRQVMKNLEAVLKAGGATFSEVVKTTLYLTDMSDFAAVNEVYGAFFPDNPPARAAVAVAKLPMDVRLMIDAVAVV